jgi:hypothetical protein
MIKIEFSEQEIAVLVQLMNGVSGMENAKMLLPIYEKFKAAAAEKASDEADE